MRGQHQAKQAVASILYKLQLHGLCLDNPDTLAAMDISDSCHFRPQPLLLIGPTGCGKTHLIKCATDFVNIPYSFIAATSLVQTGYVGVTIEKHLESHYFRCQKNLQRTERPILYFDEIDKIRSQPHASGPDVSGEGVQNALLTLFDGQRFTVSENGTSETSAKVDINTAGILCICTGGFAAGLPSIIRARTGNQHLSDADLLSLTQTEDLVQFGFIPEFVGRFGCIATLDPLTTENLVGILAETKSSPIEKHKTLFTLHGIELKFTTAALKAIAQQAIKLQTGARGLERIVQACLNELEFQLPDLADAGVSQVTIDEYTLLEGRPILKYESSPGNNRLALLDRLQEQATDSAPQSTVPLGGSDRRFSDSKTMTTEQIWDRIAALKQQKLGWDDTTGSARKWWEAFEQENRHKPVLILRLAEELAFMEPPATITEFFLAYVYSNTDNIQANIYYLQYTRLKKAEDKRKAKERHGKEETE